MNIQILIGAMYKPITRMKSGCPYLPKARDIGPTQAAISRIDRTPNPTQNSSPKAQNKETKIPHAPLLALAEIPWGIIIGERTHDNQPTHKPICISVEMSSSERQSTYEFGIILQYIVLIHLTS